MMYLASAVVLFLGLAVDNSEAARGTRRRLSPSGSSSKSGKGKGKSDPSRSLLECTAFKGKGKGSSKSKSSSSDDLDLPDVPECPCCDIDTCEYLMEFEFCGETPGFVSFDQDDASVCRYNLEGDPDSDTFSGLEAIDLDQFEASCDMIMRRELAIVSKFEIESFADCCTAIGACHTTKLSGCCDLTRRNRRLNEISATNTRTVTEHDDGIHVTVEAEHEEGLGWLNLHLEEMKGRMESGDVARAWDPLFKAYFDNAKNIELKCEHSDNKVECRSKSQTQCGIDLIKAHAEYHQQIADSLDEGGDHVIEEEHLVPESCL